ncbi:MAG: hypothetical protein HYS27_16960 [Deltaproteobacteria bacterium]|nr:hypothetical protein [Deltaproteobacteria bacterium]
MTVRAALAVVVVGAAGALLALAAPGCGRPCRAVATTPIDLQCEAGAVYEGELHYDDAAVFESFLSLECLPSSSPEQIAAVVGAVDFTNDAAFVAVGRRLVQTRCVEARDAATVEVCDGGLRVSFDDRLSNAVDDCPGRWTVAFSLARDDLRAALGTDAAVDGF